MLVIICFLASFFNFDTFLILFFPCFKNCQNCNKHSKKLKMNEHNSKRSKLCVICCRFGKPMSQSIQELVREFVVEGYSVQDPRFPAGICDTCRLVLGKFKKGDFSKSLPPFFDYSPMATYHIPRTDCQCCICQVYPKKGFFGAKIKKAKRLKNQSKSTTSSSISSNFSMLCPKCLSPVLSESRHSCLKDKKVENLKLSLSKQERKRVAYELIKEDLESTGNAVLSSLGRPIKVEKKKKKSIEKVKKQLTYEDVGHLKVSMNLSGNQSNKVMSVLRSKLGRSIVQPFAREKMYEQNASLLEFFDKTFYHGGSESRPVVFCKNVPGFLSKIAEFRHYTGNELLKLGIDSGRNSLKVTVSVVDTTKTNRKPSKFLDTGVKKLFVLAVALDVAESYDSIKFLWNLLKLEQIGKFLFTGDYKVINIILGLQNHAGMYPCPFCVSYNKKNRDPQPPLNLRSWKSIEAENEKWITQGRKHNELKSFFNCINKPLLAFDGPTFWQISPAPLHLVIGLVNKLFKALVDVFPSAESWPKMLGMCVQPQHQDFNGNDSRKLIKNTQLLRNMVTTRRESKVVGPFIATFDELDNLIKSCFGQTLDQNFQFQIAKFKAAFLELNLSISTKLHVIFCHLEEYIVKTGRSLSLDSEQALESCHYDFLTVLQRYMGRNLENEKCADQLLSAVGAYNSSHL